MKPNAVNQLVEMGEQMMLNGFTNQFDIQIVTIETESGPRSMPIRSAEFGAHLVAKYRVEFGIPPSRAVNEALSHLSAGILYDGQRSKSHTRIGGDRDLIELDLGTGRFVQIRSTGISVVDESVNVFIRPSTMLPLPEPITGASLDEIRPMFRCAEGDDDWLSLQSVCVGLLKPFDSQPIILLEGEQGSGKTSAARLLKRLVDPAVPMLRGGRFNDDDLMLSAMKSWLVTADNVSFMSSAEADARCRLSTGAGRGKRRLYTDSDEVVYEAVRPQVITSIGMPTNRPDVIDRTIRLSFLPMTSADQRSERQLDEEFEALHPAMLGALLEMASTAMRRLPDVRLAESPRLRDHAEWGVAALSQDGPKLIDALLGNRRDQSDDALATNPVAEVVQVLLRQRGEAIEDTPTSIYEEACRIMDYSSSGTYKSRKDWPKSVGMFSHSLKRIAPELRAHGVEVEQGLMRGTGNNRERLIRISRADTGSLSPKPTR